MQSNKKILLTGAAGFIGSYLLGELNRRGWTNIIIADEFAEEDKWFNFEDKQFSDKVERADLFRWLADHDPEIEMVFHLGARTDTTEFNYAIHEQLNLEYSKSIWSYCVAKKIPLVYASSAATYGAGELGYKDDHELAWRLQPLNPYGISKNEFDKWALQQETMPQGWVGLKFFNVYGPNEYHKGRMASMIYHGYRQIRKTGKVKLFRSHRPDYRDGQQLRDFIYVKDVAAVCCWLMEQMNRTRTEQPLWNLSKNGLYNLGTGKARSFEDLEKATFAAMGKPVQIEYIDMPEDIRDKYQYFTEADMHKLREAGYQQAFTTLEEGVREYVQDYLMTSRYF